MYLALIITLFISVFTFTVFIGSYILPKLSFRYRMKHLINETELIKKEKKKSTTKDNSRFGKFMKKLEVDIEAASLPLTPKEFLFILMGSNILIILIGTVIASLKVSVFICIILDFLVFRILPRFQKRRKNKMVQQLPDVLDLISNAMKTGYSIVQTIDLVSKENFQPISEEFEKLVQALKYGESFEKAFTDLANRLDIPELKTVVDTILITRETGGNMTHVIDGLLEMMRENQRLQGEVKALTAQGRISSWVIGSLPLFLFALLTFISPDYMLLLFQHPLGIAMVVVAGISQIIGYVVMHKLIQLKVW
jgi:tight adherence protein B